MTTSEKQQQPFEFDPKISLIIGFSISTSIRNWRWRQKCQIISHVVGVGLFLYGWPSSGPVCGVEFSWPIVTYLVKILALCKDIARNWIPKERYLNFGPMTLIYLSHSGNIICLVRLAFAYVAFDYKMLESLNYELVRVGICVVRYTFLIQFFPETSWSIIPWLYIFPFLYHGIDHTHAHALLLALNFKTYLTVNKEAFHFCNIPKYKRNIN